MDLFVYGTLLDDALVLRLTGRGFRKEPAVLAGYHRVQPPGGYPYITPDRTGTVEGVVLCDVDAVALSAFDQYEDEGHLYRRAEVTVTVGGQARQALVYVGI